MMDNLMCHDGHNFMCVALSPFQIVQTYKNILKLH